MPAVPTLDVCATFTLQRMTRLWVQTQMECFVMPFNASYTQLTEALKNTLGELGLAKANQVLFTGVAWGGTIVYLNADRVHAQIKAMNPGLKKFKALPVDGLHPKQWTVQ